MDFNALKEAAERYPEEILFPYSDIIGIIGFEGMCALSQTFGGTNIYIPGEKRIFGGCIYRAIIDQFNGANHKTLAKKFGYSERSVRHFISLSR